MDRKKSFYQHFRTTNGDLTVCVLSDKDITNADEVVEWVMGMAMCSPRDQFSRKIGREISSARAFLGGEMVISSSRKNLFRNIEAFVLTGNRKTFNTVMGTKRLPSWFPKCKKAYTRDFIKDSEEKAIASSIKKA